MNEKKSLEFHAVLSFTEEYNRTHRRTLQLVHLCEPPMPDTLCLLHRREIGIEVAHIYGTGIEAAIRLGHQKSEDYPDEVHQARRITPLPLRVLPALKRVLRKKATRSYDMHPVWLLIRNGFPLWSLADYRRHKSCVHVPENSPFSQVWLVCDRNCAPPHGIMRL